MVLSREKRIETDALIVGGGPVGLALAVGLRGKGLNVTVVEREGEPDEDWSRAYSYRIDQRGIQCFEKLGLVPKLEAIGVESRGFSSTLWYPDGSKIDRVRGNAGLGLGYWVQRPFLLRLLQEALHTDLRFQVIRGDVKSIQLNDGKAEAEVETLTGKQTISSMLVFGCDGSRSIVRETLQGFSEDNAQAFAQASIDTPSSGLIYKALLYKPTDDMSPGQIYNAVGKSGMKLSFLPFSGKAGEMRPVSFAQPPSHVFHSWQTSEEVYCRLGEDFPQLDVYNRLPKESAEAWCQNPGSTFPKARFCKKASAWVRGVWFALLGDALHSFPPDLGQGVNAGLSDVTKLLDLWPENVTTRFALQDCFEAYDQSQGPEAEAICHLIPIGMPYQYNLPFSLSKVVWFSTFLVRAIAWKAFPSVFYPPVVFAVTQDPPTKYTAILDQHTSNTQLLTVISVGLFGMIVTLHRIWRR